MHAGRYVMSVAAQLCGLHPQTLRLYERRGLLGPARSRGGTRLYSDDDLDRLARITALTSDGINLEGVRRILQLEDELAALRARLAPTTEPSPPAAVADGKRRTPSTTRR